MDKTHILEPHVCEWLHCAWRQLHNMEEMILKGWDKARITTAFYNEFQLTTMEANVISLLFKITPNIENHKETYFDNDPKQETITIMKKCLQANVIITSTSNATIGCSTTSYKTRSKQLARKQKTLE